jgi:hypothetical protein
VNSNAMLTYHDKGRAGATIGNVSSVSDFMKEVWLLMLPRRTYSAANRDPEQFPEPDKFILNRDNITSHLGFGRGRHRCAGMPLVSLNFCSSSSSHN